METSPESLVPEEEGGGNPGATGCRLCGSEDIEPGYLGRLCAGCRRQLSHRPLPGWIRAVGVLVLVTTLIAIALSPMSLKAGIAFERGRRAEQNHQFAAAAREYERVVDRFPQSTTAVARLGIAYFRSGQWAEAIVQFKKLAGQKLDPKLADEINATIQQMEVRGRLTKETPQP